MKRAWAVVAVAGAFAACGTPQGRVTMARFVTTPRAPTTDVDVYMVGQQPQRGFRLLALFTAEGAPDDEATCLEGMLVRAREIGADGLMLLPPPRRDDKTVTVEITSGPWGGGMRGGVYRAHAIAYE